MGVLFRHGLLGSREQQWIQSAINEYPNAVLLSKNLDNDWIDKNLKVFDSVGEDCMGQSYPKKTHMYSIIKTNFGQLYFFLDKDDYDKVCALPDIVLDPQPFMTFLPGTVLDKIFV